jgi:crossover junction endodeoxyribonuclease RusA
MRAFVRGNRAALTSDNPRLRSWRRDVTVSAVEAHGWRDPMAGAIEIVLTFALPRPKSHYGKHGLLPSAPAHPTGRPDLDKLERGILDALTAAGVWIDDAQVVAIAGSKHWATPLMPPGCIVAVGEVDAAGDAA